MFCKNCGCEISDRAKVCHHCGTKIVKKDLRKHESHPVSAPSSKNTLAIIGFVISLSITVAGFILNILIYKNVANIGEAVAYCVIIFLIAVVGFICSFLGHKKADVNEIEKMAYAGVALSVIISILTIIFLILDIVEINTLHFVPVHS